MSRLERLYAPPEIGAPGKQQASSRRRDLVFAGAFVLAMLIAAAGLLLLVGPGLAGFGSAYRLRAYFNEAEGLSPGIPVIQEGYSIGAVVAVEPVFPGRDADARRCPPAEATTRAPDLPCFRATLRIIDDWPIPADSTARLGSAGLLKGEAIRITPGIADETLAADAVIDARGRERDLIAQVAALTDTLQALIEETISPALASIQAQIDTIGQLLGTGEEGATEDLAAVGRERLAGVFDNLQQVSANIERSVDPEQIRGILGSVSQLTENLAALSATFSDRSQDISKAVQSYDALAGEIRELISRNEPDVQASLEDTQYLLQELSAALTPILANIETASRNLAALSGDLRQDPKSLLFSNPPKEPPPWFER